MLNATTFVYLSTGSLGWWKWENKWKKKKIKQFLHSHKHDNSSTNIRSKCSHTHINTDSHRNPSTQGNERMIKKIRCENERNEDEKKNGWNIKAKRTLPIEDDFNILIIALRTWNVNSQCLDAPNGVYKPRVLNGYRRLNYGANSVQNYYILVSKQTIQLIQTQMQKQNKKTYMCQVKIDMKISRRMDTKKFQKKKIKIISIHFSVMLIFYASV